jgi:hypothetical protein
LKKDLKIISNSNNVNIYYNYLIDNNLNYETNISINLHNLRNSLIIRNEKDFHELFKLTSYRTRSAIIHDRAYRQHNIKQLYNTFDNNNYVLYPNKILSFDEIFKK